MHWNPLTHSVDQWINEWKGWMDHINGGDYSFRSTLAVLTNIRSSFAHLVSTFCVSHAVEATLIFRWRYYFYSFNFSKPLFCVFFWNIFSNVSPLIYVYVCVYVYTYTYLYNVHNVYMSSLAEVRDLHPGAKRKDDIYVYIFSFDWFVWERFESRNNCQSHLSALVWEFRSDKMQSSFLTPEFRSHQNINCQKINKNLW